MTKHITNDKISKEQQFVLFGTSWVFSRFSLSFSGVVVVGWLVGGFFCLLVGWLVLNKFFVKSTSLPEQDKTQVDWVSQLSTSPSCECWLTETIVTGSYNGETPSKDLRPPSSLVTFQKECHQWCGTDETCDSNIKTKARLTNSRSNTRMP